VQCFGTFRGFLHKLYAATMDGKGQKGTYIFLTTTGRQPWGREAGHRAQGAAAPPLPPRWRRQRLGSVLDLRILSPSECCPCSCMVCRVMKAESTVNLLYAAECVAMAAVERGRGFRTRKSNIEMLAFLYNVRFEKCTVWPIQQKDQS